MENSTYELFHFLGSYITSWYDFAVAIQDVAFEKGLLDKKIPIQPIPASAYPTPAKRPIFSLLYKEQKENTEHWKGSLKTIITELFNKAS